jgi:heterodisulfide reductase subunit C
MIEYDKLDHDFLCDVMKRPGGERAANCYLCGTCTAGCPVSAQRSEYNPRRIMKMVQLGLKEPLLSSPELWQCTQCHVCVAHCPQDARCADVVRILRQMAIEEGYATQELADDVEKLDEDLKRKRIELVKERTGKKL